MICLKCGWCCKNLMVMVVDDPEKGLVPGNIIYHPGNGENCKHLLDDNACAVHDCKWYPDTPCAQFDQVGGGECRIGQYVLQVACLAPPTTCRTRWPK